MKKHTKKDIRENMLMSYLKMFLLSLLVILIIYLILIISNQFIKGKLISQKIDIKEYLVEDFRETNYSQILENNGGIAVLDEEMKLIHQEGNDFLDAQQFKKMEWAKFLIDSQKIDAPYNYQVAYSEKADGYWLIIALPSSVRMMFSFYYNGNITPHDQAIVIPFLAFLFLVFIVLLFIITWIFTTSTANKYIQPILELESNLKAFSEGDYKKRIEIHKKNIIANLADIYNQMADKIQSQINTRRDLILDISHDIKNPLMSSTGYCEYLLNNPDLSSEKRLSYYKIIYNDSMRAVKIADDLLQLSKLENDEVNMNCEKTDICEFIREEIARIIPVLDEQQFEYDFNIPPKSIFGDIDKSLISRVVDNLITNSIKYNSKETKIYVSVLEDTHYVSLVFEDDGIGIPKEIYSDITKPFVRGETTYHNVQGSGLGLSIVDKIVARHGGKFMFDSHRSIGCKFVVQLVKV
jgi:signal transduction histidine kinase